MPRTQVRFHSNLFTEKETPGESAEELAKWLCSQFPDSFSADYLDEDWGCMILLSDEDLKGVDISCGHVESNQWSISCDARYSFFDRLFKKPYPKKQLETIIKFIDSSVNEEANFYDVEWFENDKQMREFNYGKRAFD